MPMALLIRHVALPIVMMPMVATASSSTRSQQLVAGWAMRHPTCLQTWLLHCAGLFQQLQPQLQISTGRLPPHPRQSQCPPQRPLPLQARAALLQRQLSMAATSPYLPCPMTSLPLQHPSPRPLAILLLDLVDS
jgi:hypothetical protein